MEIFIVLLAIALATCVVLGYLIVIWWLDRYEREPIWLVGATFLWGALGGTCLGCALSMPMTDAATLVAGAEWSDIIGTVIVAPLAEEFTKALIFLPLLFTRHIDNETDGLIYGAATGLGFATLENLLYFVSALEGGMEAFFATVLIRTLFTALVHCISSAILGMFIGYVRHRATPLRWVVYPAIGYALAVLNHAVWNGLATAAGIDGSSTAALLLLFAMALVVGASVMMFLLTQFSLNREHDVIRRYLEHEARQGTLPAPHAQIIPYWLRRRKKGWLDPRVPREAYIRTATLLAFRQHQLEIARGARRDQYLQDIARFRQQLHDLLTRAGYTRL